MGLQEPVYLFFNCSIAESRVPEALGRLAKPARPQTLDLYAKFFPQGLEAS